MLAARRMIALHGERWRVDWLRDRGLSEWADYLDRFYPRAETAARLIHPSNGLLNGHGTHTEALAEMEEGGEDAQPLL